MQSTEQITRQHQTLTAHPSHPSSEASQVNWEVIKQCLNSDLQYDDKLKKLKALLDPQKSTIAKSGQALFKAMQEKVDLKLLELLVQAGARVNLDKKDLSEEVGNRLPIELAIACCRFDYVKFMIEQAGADFVNLEFNGVTPLLVALCVRVKLINEKAEIDLESNARIIAYLLEKGINLHKKLTGSYGADGLSMAVDGCMVDIVLLITKYLRKSEEHLQELALVERRGKNLVIMSGAFAEALVKLLYCAAADQKKYVEIIRILFMNGVNTNQLLKLGTSETRAKVLDIFIALGENEFAHLLLPEFVKERADLVNRIVVAAKHNNIAILQYLLLKLEAGGYDAIFVNSFDVALDLALEAAAKNGSFETVKCLLSIPTIRISNIAYYSAAEYGHVKIFEALIKKSKSDMPGTFQGEGRQETLDHFFYAFRASGDNPKIAEIIIHEGGFTAQELLFYACKQKAKSSAICLISQFQANPNSIDGKGASALHFAIDAKDYELASALLHSKAVNAEVSQNGLTFFSACLRNLSKCLAGNQLSPSQEDEIIKILKVFDALLHCEPKLVDKELSGLDHHFKWLLFQNANLHRAKICAHVVPYIVMDCIPNSLTDDSKQKFEFCKHFSDIIVASNLHGREKQYSMMLKSVNTASISISVQVFEKSKVKDLTKVLVFCGLTQDSKLTFLFQRLELFNELFAAYQSNPKIELNDMILIFWKHSKERRQYIEAQERNKVEATRREAEIANNERIKQERLRIAQDSKARQERTINKQELLMKINKLKVQMEGETKNRRAIEAQFKQHKKDEIIGNVKKFIEIFEGKSKCELLKDYLNGRKINGRYRTTPSGQVDINDLSIEDRFQRVNEGLIAVEVIADFLQKIASLSEQNEATDNLLAELNEVFSICANTNKAKPELAKIIFIIKNQFAYDVDPDGKNFFDAVDQFFKHCDAPKFLIPENRQKIELIIRKHYSLLKNDRTEGIFFKILDYLKELKAKYLTIIYSEIGEYLKGQALADEKIQSELEVLYKQIQDNINSSNCFNLKEVQKQLEQAIRRNPHLFGYQTKNIRNCIENIMSVFRRHQSVANILLYLKNLLQNFNIMMESVDLSSDNRLSIILNILEGFRSQEKAPIKGMIDHYHKTVFELQELRENIDRLKEKIEKLSRDLTAEDQALLRQKNEQHSKDQAQKKRKDEKAKRRRQKMERGPKQVKQTEQTRATRLRYKDFLREKAKRLEPMHEGDNKRSIERSTVAAFSALARHSSGLTPQMNADPKMNADPSDKSYLSALNVPKQQTLDERTNLSGRFQIQDYLDDLKHILEKSMIEIQVALESKNDDIKESTELQRRQSLAFKIEIYAIVFLIANVMDKIKDTQDNALFSEADAALFRNRVFHDAIFRKNLTANYHLVRDLGLKILSFLSAKLSGKLSEDKERAEILLLIKKFMPENPERRDNSEEPKMPEIPSKQEFQVTFIQNDIKTCKEIMKQGAEELSEFEQNEAGLAHYYGSAFEQVWSNAHALIYSEISAYFSEYTKRCQTESDKEFSRLMRYMRKYHVPGNKLRHCEIKPSLELINELRLQEEENGTTAVLMHSQQKPNKAPELLYLRALTVSKQNSSPQIDLTTMLEKEFPALTSGAAAIKN